MDIELEQVVRMANIATKVKLYLRANDLVFDEVKIDDQIRLQNDGDGSYIHTWDVAKIGVAKPTDEQLASYEIDGNADEDARKIIVKRRLSYKDWREQFDELWHDIDDGKFGEDAKTGEWFKAVKKVKTDNPKE